MGVDCILYTCISMRSLCNVLLDCLFSMSLDLLGGRFLVFILVFICGFLTIHLFVYIYSLVSYIFFR